MALLDETMWHVDRIIEEHGAPDFGIPSVRLVEAGVALPVGQNTAYLIEELINEQIKFVKYINNASSTCIKLSDPEEEVRGLFLSFAQHHQWLVTGRLAFVSDFQGGALGSNASRYLPNHCIHRWRWATYRCSDYFKPVSKFHLLL